MKPIRTAALMLLAVSLPSSPALGSDDLEEKLRSDYQDKILTLRHFYTGKHLAFQADGSPIRSAEVGPWTVNGQLLVTHIKRHGRALEIKGRRVCLVFDAKGKPYRDVLTYLSESSLKDRAKLEDSFRSDDLEVEIELASDKPDLQEVSSAVNAVFLAPGGSIREIVPDYWQSYFDRIEGRPSSHGHSAEPWFKAKQGITPPRATYAPNPEFSEEARKAKYQGTMTVSVVVDPSGNAKDLEIMSPLGLGLDEKAIAAVRNWKFKPATKDGEPVPVKIAVEVDFHLY
jgi:TonB family protein